MGEVLRCVCVPDLLDPIRLRQPVHLLRRSWPGVGRAEKPVESDCGSELSLVHSDVHVLVREEEIEFLLRRGGRRLPDVLLFPLPFCYNLTIGIMLAGDHSIVLLVLVSAALGRFGLTTVVIEMIYYDMVRQVLGRLRRLHISSTEPTRDLRRSIPEKWDIRVRVSEVNSLFAILLCGFYFCVFTTAISLWSEASIKRIKFRDDWDSLRIDCFEHGSANFLRFMSMMTACVAVVLQFDYLVVRKINEIASHNEHSDG